MKKKKGKGRISQKKPSLPKNAKTSDRSTPKKKTNTEKPVKKEEALVVQEEKESPRMTKEGFFPIIGMGASAGGLEAFEQFFSNMPSNSGAAFVIVQHLDPNHSSIMADLLKRFTRMEVFEVEDGMCIEPSKIYVIPPNKDMTIHARTLSLVVPAEPHGLRMPIDLFLRSLAEDCGERSLCIILSGSGTDGTLGLKAINEAGGLAIVQDPLSAKYDSMPKSAIKTGLVDYALPVEKIPEQLINYIRHVFPKKRKQVTEIASLSPIALQKILMILKTKTGNDFSCYKKSTIYRRIERRMSLHNIENPAEYVRYLQERPEEVELLFKELLIVVTSFFRDQEAFDILRKKMLPEVLENKPENYTIRVWVPGCATGEEVYSIAMVLREYMDEIEREFKIQIFGTDIDETAINTARNGIYPGNIALDVSAKRLKRFFVAEDNYYRIKKEIRETAVFAVHNVIKDPPFTKMDFISCRNLLIYMDTELQNKLIPLFHYSLKPGGILFLGPSESISGFVDLFTILDKKWKFFKAKGVMPLPHEIPFAETPGMHPRMLRAGITEFPKPKEISIDEVAHKMLLDKFAPPCVIINEKGEILYIHGRTGKYLEPARGKASLNIMDMAREGIQYELHSAIHNAAATKREITYERLRVKTNGSNQEVNLTIRPIIEPRLKQTIMMVIFEDVVEKQAETKKTKGKTVDVQSKRIEALEWELKYTKEDLQATITELQASNEELKSLNEELQSTNEELQSTNEELETSKEELQSVNEELITVNSELQSKIDQLSRSENDMKNLLDSIRVGTVFLDNNLAVKRFTPDVVKVFNLIPSDIGRPISHVVANLKYENLVNDIHTVLDKLVSRECEVQTKDNYWYLMRIMPYRTLENVIDGVVLTFTDINQIKKSQDELKKFYAIIQDTGDLAEAIADSLLNSFIVLDVCFRVVSASRSFYKMFQTREEETVGKYLYDLGNKQWDIPELKNRLKDVLPNDMHFDNFTVTYNFPHIGKRTMRLHGRKIMQKEKKSPKILLSIEDITGQKDDKNAVNGGQ